jgi:signal-transduction protein with cAMP-binding, CBS, and nucleotidyltransferase domain
MVTPKLEEAARDANYAWKKSCYSGMDYTIGDESTVFEAVNKLAAYDVGCLVTKDANGNLSGVISERDYVQKIALLGKSSKDTLVRQISTKAADLVTASPSDTVDACMQKMLTRDIRHLPLVDESGAVVGIISIKDLIKTCLEEKEHVIHQLSSFAVGEGGHFVM